jgi:N-methylhydantoinase A
MFRAGIDVGGTFTDLVAVDDTGKNLKIRKIPSTRDQADGILRGLSGVTDNFEDFNDISHGTTVATNILLEGNGARVAVITTRGFRDTVEIGRCRRLVPGSIFNLKFVRPSPVAHRQHRFEVDERIGADGHIITRLDPMAVDEIARTIAKSEVEAVAICFINSYTNPSHEQEAKAIVQNLLPDLFVCCSSEIVPQVREYERFSTATVNCFVAPVMSRYMKSLITKLRARGYGLDVLTMASNAGLLSTETVLAQPVRTVLSGPAAAVNGAAYIGKLAAKSQLITYDMGGTSTDVCLIDNGEPLVAAETVQTGIPISIPQLDIHTVGTGGGSIAWIDVDAKPRVGPQSAGSEPGPIASGKGGTQITITDANLLLGRLPEKILDGAINFAVEPVRAAFDMFCSKLKFSGRREDLAEGLIRLAVSSMAGSVRKISIERGHDPRDFAMFAIGGAGPMHAALVADELEIRAVIVPPLPGNISALGHLVGDLKYEAMQNFRAVLNDFRQKGGHAVLDALANKARARLQVDGVSRKVIKTRYAADLRYVGQSYEITVPVTRPCSATQIRRDFVALYQKRYGHQHDKTIEFTGLKAICVAGKRAKLVLESEPDESPRPASSRRVYFGGRWHRARVMRRSRISRRDVVSGPAIIEEYGATTVVPPGWKARLGAAGCLFLVR